MNSEEWDGLKEGDIIRHDSGWKGFTIVAKISDKCRIYYVLQRMTIAENPGEWTLAAKSNLKIEKGVPPCT